jgi:membrane-associated protein
VFALLGVSAIFWRVLCRAYEGRFLDTIPWTALFGAVDQFFLALARQHHALAYGMLFAIVFAETGLVFMAFLPGDSMLFVTGALAGNGAFSLLILLLCIGVAAFLGNALNYLIGSWLGHKVYDGSLRWINRQSLDRTHAFFERHGGKTVMIARFIPVVRSFAPLVAGASEMSASRFHGFSAAGAVLWTGSLVGGGYLFGNVPIVRDHLGMVLLVGLSSAIVPLALMGLAQLFKRGPRTPAP